MATIDARSAKGPFVIPLLGIAFCSCDCFDVFVSEPEDEILLCILRIVVLNAVGTFPRASEEDLKELARIFEWL